MRSIRTTLTLLIAASILLSSDATGKPGDAPPTLEAEVINDTDNPVPVQIVGARPEPFQETGGSFDVSQVFIDVTNPGKRLVVEHVSLQVQVDPGSPVSCDVRVDNEGSVVARHELVLFFQGAFPARDIYAASTPIKMYAPSGAAMVFTCNVAAGDSAFDLMLVSASGEWVAE